MAAISGCLCLFLTLWMAGSKRPAVPWTVASDPWWGTQEAFEIKRAGERLRGALLQFHCWAALDAFLEARDLAACIGEPFGLSVSAVNLSSLYLQSWDIASALRAAEEGVSNSEEIRPRKSRKDACPLVAANVEEWRIFRSFMETAPEARRTGDARLATESFQAAELNRAANLPESQASAAWRGKLPSEYWQDLAKLHAEPSKNGHGDGPGASAGIRSGNQLARTETETKAGLGSLTNKFPNKFENFHGRTSLIHFHLGLRKSELFLEVVFRGTRVVLVGSDSNDAEHALAAGCEGDPGRGQTVSRGSTSRRRSGQKIQEDW